jgi:hypothetical protein
VLFPYRSKVSGAHNKSGEVSAKFHHMRTYRLLIPDLSEDDNFN